MGGGDINIGRVENATSKQSSYDRKLAKIMNKAQKLHLLCDAEVALIMFSDTGETSHYISPNTTPEDLYNKYQQALGRDIWQPQYEKMQHELKNLENMNTQLRRQIRQRVGEDDLDDLSFHELRALEQDLDKSVTIVYERKMFTANLEIERCKKQLRQLENIQYLLREAYEKDTSDALVNSEGVANGEGAQSTFSSQPKLEMIEEVDELEGGYGLQDLHFG